MSIIRVNKSDLTFDGDKIEKAQATQSGHPMVKCQATLVEDTNKTTTLTIYGDNVASLLALPCDETDKELVFGAAYSNKSSKFVSNLDAALQAISGQPTNGSPVPPVGAVPPVAPQIPTGWAAHPTSAGYMYEVANPTNVKAIA